MATRELNEDDINKALVKFNERIGCKIDNLKPKQKNALHDVVNGHDVIAALPTGYGKSLIYELIPFVLQDTKVIVVEPLNVIINQQISKLDGMAVQLKELNLRPASSKDVTLSNRHILDVLFNELKVKLGATPLTIVYFNSSLNYIGFAYEHACRVLGNLVYNGEKNPENARVVMYHASVEYGSEKLRELIFHQISSEDSPLRIILASSALGMGADFGRVERIVHAGPPKSIEAYIQQVGRTGRTGKQATAILFFNNSDVGRPEMNKTMKSFCRNESTCRRKILNDYFGFMDDTNESENKATLCCIICNPILNECT
nr:Bloom syndrome protein homolog [Crassostrea gigas]